MEHRRSTPVRVALPWWEAAQRDARDSGDEPVLPALQWLNGRAARRYTLQSSWRDWLVQGSGLGANAMQRFPAGPCVRHALRGGRPTGVWSVAQPVHLAAAIDHLRLAPVHDLAISCEEARELHSTLHPHLAGGGLELDCAAPDVWTLHGGDAVECTTFEPAPLVGHNVHDYMPAGRDGPAMRRLMNEIQMLLHEHPVNESRARARRPTINSLWLWGFGAAPATTSQLLPTLLTDDHWLDGLWRLHGQAVSALDGAQAIRTAYADGGLIAATRPPAGSVADSLAEIDAGMLDAARNAVQHGACRSLEVCLGSTVIVLDPSSRWRFWRAPRSLDPVPA